jgi:hypothetical protein
MKKMHCRRSVNWGTTGLEPLVWPELDMVDGGGIRAFESHPK